MSFNEGEQLFLLLTGSMKWITFYKTLESKNVAQLLWNLQDHEYAMRNACIRFKEFLAGHCIIWEGLVMLFKVNQSW